VIVGIINSVLVNLRGLIARRIEALSFKNDAIQLNASFVKENSPNSSKIGPLCTLLGDHQYYGG